ncbi:hypothetical protein [Xanthomonas phage SB4]|uniref:Uncharacterized protein n=1 Tax=Xanthomonas phage SB4 TaxID=3117473 RepID=A0ABZ2GYA4_9CAUD
MALMAVSMSRTKLDEEEYALLLKKLQGFHLPVVNSGMSEQDVAFRMGIQYVLHFLREGWNQ